MQIKWAADTVWRTALDPCVAAGVAATPMASPIEAAWLAPRHHIDRVRSACAGSTLPDGQPGCTLLDDPVGFERADTLPAVYDAVAAFFQIQLATPPPAPATPS